MSQQTTVTGVDHSGVKFPPPLIYAGFFVAGLLLQRLLPLPKLPVFFSRVAGLMLGGVGLGLALGSVALFRQAGTNVAPIKPSTTLVKAGPYRFTRNPMYVGLSFLYLGLGLWRQVWWALILLPGLILMIQHQVIAREERYLERKFGAAYVDYKRLVRRWL